MEQLVLKFILIFLLKKCQVNSPLMGSIRTAAGTAAGSGPGTATTFCLLVQCFPPPLLEQKKKKSRKFLPVGSRHHVHYALVKTMASLAEEGSIQPLVPVTHAMWAAGRNLVTARKKKFVGACTRRKPSLRVGYRDPSSRI